ncbi:MAG: thioredoxin family protein [Gammaproteobacteria bacterium]|nr:thioredoxin family protein [Gammaproteobacteria bacterium]
MSPTPDALLLISSGCPHCPAVLQAMSELIKSGDIGRLEVINIQQHPEQAEQYQVRSVPWLQLGPFELTGLRSKTELQQWIQRIGDPKAMGDYFGELMTSGEMNKVHQLIKNNPAFFSQLIGLMADEATSLSVRIGVGAIIEEFSGSPLLKQHIDTLGGYTRHANARVRNDACYYLGLSQDRAAEKYIEPLLDDTDPEVREVAEEALAELNQA